MPPPRPFKGSSHPRSWWLESLLLLTLLALGWLTYHLSARALEQRVLANFATATELAGRNVRLFFEEKAGRAEAFSQLPVFRQALRDRDCPLALERLRILKRTDASLDRSFLSDGRGVLWCDHPSDPAVRGRDFSHREWFQGVSRSGRAYLSGVYHRSAAPAIPVIALAHPVIGERGLAGVLVQQYAMDDLSRLGTQVQVGRRGWMLLIDPAGRVAMHPSLAPDDPRLAAYAQLPPVAEALAGRGASAELSDPLSGQAVLLSASPLELFGRRWAVVALVAKDDAYAMGSLRLKLGLAALLLGGLALLLLRRIHRAHQQAVELNLALEDQNQELQALNEEQMALSEELEASNAELNQENEGRRQAEEELRALQAGLERQVEERTQELAAKDQLFLQAQKMEAVGRLAGGIAHDFNNLLTVVLGHAAMLQESLKDPAAKESAATIRQSAERGARLINQLLVFARRQTVKAQPLDLAPLLEAMRPLLLPLLGPDARLEFALEPGLPRVLADPGQMEQVVMNLVVNGRDAISGRAGCVTLGLRRGRADDEVNGPRPGNGPEQWVVLTVADNGSGIAPDLLPSIFEPFFTTKAVGKGTGLGLPMVQGAVQKAGGLVRVKSEPGKGSEFRIFLPPMEGLADESAGEPSMERAPGQLAPARILLVEDEDSLRQLARLVLSDAGYQVIDAPSMEAALQKVQEQRQGVDLLLSDLVMPGGSGVDLARALLERQPGLKVILMTGYTETSLPDPGQMTYRFLQKPFSPSALLAMVRDSLA